MTVAQKLALLTVVRRTPRSHQPYDTSLGDTYDAVWITDGHQLQQPLGSGVNVVEIDPARATVGGDPGLYAVTFTVFVSGDRIVNYDDFAPGTAHLSGEGAERLLASAEEGTPLLGGEGGDDA